MMRSMLECISVNFVHTTFASHEELMAVIARIIFLYSSQHRGGWVVGRNRKSIKKLRLKKKKTKTNPLDSGDGVLGHVWQSRLYGWRRRPHVGIYT